MQSLSHHPQLSFNLVVSSVDPFRSPENTAWKHWSKQMHINHQGAGRDALHSAFPTMSLTDLISSWTSDPDTSSLLSAWPLLFWLHLPLLPLRFGTPLASGTAPSWEHPPGLFLLESGPFLGQGSGQTPAEQPQRGPSAAPLLPYESVPSMFHSPKVPVAPTGWETTAPFSRAQQHYLDCQDLA